MLRCHVTSVLRSRGCCLAGALPTSLSLLPQTSRISSATATSFGLQRRCQSNSMSANGPTVNVDTGTSAVALTYEEVWSRWNEGNLFSLPVVQMREFLSAAGVATDPAAKKAAVVRRLEQYLQSKDASTSSAGAAAAAAAPAGDGGYGNWAAAGQTQPETLLDLAQAGFYHGTASIVPRAFQLFAMGSSAEALVSRVNTAAFPGFPANTECYTLSSSDGEGALLARYSKVLQWCLLNMSNLRMDGELSVAVGKLLLLPSAMRQNERIVSAYTLQQRLQLTRPYTWVSTVPESAIATVEAFLAEQGFGLVTKTPRLTYEGVVKRANDNIEVTLNENMKVDGVHAEWVDVQTAFCTSLEQPDLRVLLRSRRPVSGQDQETYTRTPIVEVANDDVTDVLPSELGQLIYLSENESRHFERLNDKGIAVVVREVRRQPLIVLRDSEEDPRVEYSIQVSIPASAGNRSMDVRAVGLEVLALAESLSAAVQAPFNEAYGMPVTTTPAAAPSA